MKALYLPGPPNRLRMWHVAYGWWLLGTYAHAVHGSVVQRTFVGPGSIRRAARWIEKRGGDRG